MYFDRLIRLYTSKKNPYNKIYYYKGGEFMDDLMEVDLLGENASELINRLSRQLEHSRDLNDLFTTFVDIDKLDIPEEVKNIIKTKIQICKDDKEQ